MLPNFDLLVLALILIVCLISSRHPKHKPSDGPVPIDTECLVLVCIGILLVAFAGRYLILHWRS